MNSRIKKALANPDLAIAHIRRNLPSFRSLSFDFAREHRSESDDGKYNVSIRRALGSQAAFDNFKRDPHYNTVLEHVSRDQTQDYYDVLRQRDDGFLAKALETVLVSDRIGNPRRYKVGDVAQPLSGTTLRYVKVASDLNILFGGKFNSSAEIGCGYGGQCLVNDQLLDIERATLFDLPIALQLIERYLENFILRGSYETSSINKVGQEKYDLVISNYAFSELPRSLQAVYIEKVLSKAKFGYLTMNSGRGGPFDESFPKHSLKELESMLPKFEVFEEQPLTFAYNYIIAWGHSGSL